MNTFIASDLPDDKFFEKDALIDKKFIVCPAGYPISRILRDELAEWEFDRIFSEGEILDNSPLIVKGEGQQGADRQPGNGQGELDEEAKDGKKPEKSAKRGAVANAARDKELVSIKDAYKGYLEYAESVYENYERTQQLNAEEITEKMREFCAFVRQNKRNVLRLQSEESESTGKTYLAKHSVRSTVFALAIGIQLDFPKHRMVELAVSCFLHEIGMARLPKKFFTSSEPLSTQERKAITAHPVLSYNILRAASFPLNICIGALEHHERENGRGYPRRLTREQISNYAKIISVACSYEAATAKRPFKEEKDAYSGIVDILKNKGHQYDTSIVRALLVSLSLYPIGIYVLLSDGRKGEVVDINPEDPKYPIVHPLGEYKPDGMPKTIETSEYSVYIVRPLTKSELEQD